MVLSSAWPSLKKVISGVGVRLVLANSAPRIRGLSNCLRKSRSSLTKAKTSCNVLLVLAMLLLWPTKVSCLHGVSTSMGNLDRVTMRQGIHLKWFNMLLQVTNFTQLLRLNAANMQLSWLTLTAALTHGVKATLEWVIKWIKSTCLKLLRWIPKIVFSLTYSPMKTQSYSMHQFVCMQSSQGVDQHLVAL